MIYIHNFSVSPDGSQIYVDVETDEGETFTSADFWTDATFQDESQAIDITSLLAQTSNREVFSINASDVGVTDFYDGIFFVEFSTSQVTIENPDTGCNECNNPIAVAAKLISAKLCLLEKVKEFHVCNTGCGGCEDGCGCGACDIINLDNTIDAMSIALQYAQYTVAIDLLNVIRKLCTTCTECLDLEGISANSGLNYYTLNNEFILV